MDDSTDDNLIEERREPEELEKNKIFPWAKKSDGKSTAAQPDGGNRSKWLVAIVVLLVLQLAASGYQIYTGIVRDRQAAINQAVVNKSVATYTANLDQLANQMLTDYKTNVYNNTKVDTTSKQQVLGNEYNFNALMLIIKQNSRMMELMAQAK